MFAPLSGSHRKNGMLSVSLAAPDGSVFGGGVVGSLRAAGPIQVSVLFLFFRGNGIEFMLRIQLEPIPIQS